MYTSVHAKQLLLSQAWEDGKVIHVCEGPYRTRIVVHCSLKGRQKTMFENGEHPYFSYMELLDPNGSWIKQGASMVPVLSDGRFLMVVEQRPAQGRYDNVASIAKIYGEDIDIKQFGPFSSLEFPGGAIDTGEGIKAGFLRELSEETGVENQLAKYYGRRRPLYPQGSDMALQANLGVVFLSGVKFEKYVATDGGLLVFALSRAEVMLNIHRGVICSGQAALLPWAFYREVEEARASEEVMRRMVDSGYLAVEDVKIAKTNIGPAKK